MFAFWVSLETSLVCVAILLVQAIYRLAQDVKRSPDWPVGAATIIAALIIINHRGGASRPCSQLGRGGPGLKARLLTEVLWYWPAIALVVAADRAAIDERRTTRSSLAALSRC